MNNMFKTWIFFCLFGLAGNVISSDNQPLPWVDAIEYEWSIDSNNIASSVLFPTPDPYLFLAESIQEITSEIEPRSFTPTGWTPLLKKYDADALYIQRSYSFLLSQAVRNMIFPFHSYL